MPSKEAHIGAAKRNQRTIDYLLAGDGHLAWVTTVAFYKALHIVEAVFDGDKHSPVAHTDDHKTRNSVLKRTTRYAQIWKMYQPLFQASLVARYLRDNENDPTFEIFDRYMPREDVEKIVLNHYLRQIEKSAGNLIGDPGFLKD